MEGKRKSVQQRQAQQGQKHDRSLARRTILHHNLQNRPVLPCISEYFYRRRTLRSDYGNHHRVYHHEGPAGKDAQVGALQVAVQSLFSEYYALHETYDGSPRNIILPAGIQVGTPYYLKDINDIIKKKRYQDMLKGFKDNKKCELLCRKCKYLNK